jgi:hypothetical protein
LPHAGEFNVTVNRLIEHNERDIQRLRNNVSVLKGRPGTEQFIGEFERQIVEILKCNTILRAAA